MDNSLEQLYAEKWQASSKFFMDNDYYKHMAKVLKPFKTVLELGSTVAVMSSLLDKRHVE